MRLSTPRRLLRHGFRRAESVMDFLRRDRAHGGTVNLGLLQQGFFSMRAQLYPFERYDARWFLNDWAIEYRLRRINPPAVHTQLGNKLFLHLLLRELGFGATMVPLLGVLSDGRFTSFSRCGSLDEARAAHAAVVVKPIDGYGGVGVRRCGPEDVLPDRGTYVVEAALQQHPYAAAVFPGSVNTLRVMTLRLNGEEPFIAGAAHRFGRSSTAPVDNFSRGGVAAFVDPLSGRLTSARTKPELHDTSHHAVHPDTGTVIEGLVVPAWDEVKALALELMRRVPGVQLAGWDICVTPEGPRLIEGNGSVPNPDLIQAHRPLLLDAATRRFFHAKRVISTAQFETLERQAAEPPRPPLRGATRSIRGVA